MAKEWYSNKWGWAGAVVGLLTILLTYTTQKRTYFIFSWLFPSTTSGGLCNIFPSWCGGDVIGYAIASLIIGLPLQIITGFLLGLSLLVQLTVLLLVVVWLVLGLLVLALAGLFYWCNPAF